MDVQASDRRGHGRGSRRLYEAGPGAILGGISVFGGVPMMETVTCLEETQIAIFPRKLFSEVATQRAGKSITDPKDPFC